MEISRDALLRIVKAARESDRLAQDMKKMMFDKSCWTVADDISANLCEALYVLSGETLTELQDFNTDSSTMKLIRSEDMSDGDVTDEFIECARQNKPQMPPPRLISKPQFESMVNRFGGYKATPEGEWK